MKVISVRQIRSVNFTLPNGIKASRPLFQAGIYQQTLRVKGGGYYYKLICNYGAPSFSNIKVMDQARKSQYMCKFSVRDKDNVTNEELWFVKENI